MRPPPAVRLIVREDDRRANGRGLVDTWRMRQRASRSMVGEEGSHRLRVFIGGFRIRDQELTRSPESLDDFPVRGGRLWIEPEARPKVRGLPVVPPLKAGDAVDFGFAPTEQFGLDIPSFSHVARVPPASYTRRRARRVERLVNRAPIVPRAYRLSTGAKEKDMEHREIIIDALERMDHARSVGRVRSVTLVHVGGSRREGLTGTLRPTLHGRVAIVDVHWPLHGDLSFRCTDGAQGEWSRGRWCPAARASWRLRRADCAAFREVADSMSGAVARRCTP